MDDTTEFMMEVAEQIGRLERERDEARAVVERVRALCDQRERNASGNLPYLDTNEIRDSLDEEA